MRGFHRSEIACPVCPTVPGSDTHVPVAFRPCSGGVPLETGTCKLLSLKYLPSFAAGIGSFFQKSVDLRLSSSPTCPFLRRQRATSTSICRIEHGLLVSLLFHFVVKMEQVKCRILSGLRGKFVSFYAQLKMKHFGTICLESEPPAPLLPEKGWPKAGVEGVAGGHFGNREVFNAKTLSPQRSSEFKLQLVGISKIDRTFRVFGSVGANCL